MGILHGDWTKAAAIEMWNRRTPQPVTEVNAQTDRACKTDLNNQLKP